MMTRRSSPLGALLAVLVAVVLAACGGSASHSPSAGRPSPSATPSAAPTESGSDDPDPSGSAVDLSDATDALAELDSYTITLEASGPVASDDGSAVRVTSTVVQGEEPAARFTITGMASAPAGMSIVVIGDEAWIDIGNGGWLKSPGGAADFEATFLSLSPAFIVAEFSSVQAGILKVGDEERNGVATEHFRLDADESPEVAQAAGIGDGIFELWIAKDGGYLVSARFAGTYAPTGSPEPATMSIDVTDINSPDNVIEPPA